MTGIRQTLGIALLLAAVRLQSEEKPLEQYLRNAQVYLDQEKFGEAIAQLKKAIAHQPSLPGAYYQLGYCHWKLNHLAEARQAFEQELKFPPPDAYSLYYLGRIFQTEGNAAAAIQHFDKTAGISPILDVFERLGNLHLQAGYVERAIEYLEKSVQLHPDRGDAHYLLARAYLRTGRNADARQQFALTTRLKAEDRQAIRDLLECEEYLKQNRVDDALRMARNLAQSRDADVLLALGRTLGQYRQHQDALKVLERAASLQSSFFEAQFNLGLTLAALKDIPRAKEALNEAVRLKPESYDAQLLLGTILVESGKDDEAAIRHLRKAAEIRGENPRLLALLGMRYTQSRYYMEAIATLSKAVQLDPGNPEIRFLLLQAHDRNQDYEDSLKLARETLDAFPKLPRSHFEVALRHHAMGRFLEAQPHLENALALDSNFAEAQAMLGDVLLRQGKMEESLPWFRKALVRRPDLMEAYAGLGKALLQLKRYDEAAGEMQKAVRTEPDYPQSHLYLSQAHRALGRTEEARRETELFTRLNRQRAEQRDREGGRNYVP
jgi:tetratricopeptide (TPR) repeat protein